MGHSGASTVQHRHYNSPYIKSCTWSNAEPPRVATHMLLLSALKIDSSVTTWNARRLVHVHGRRTVWRQRPKGSHIAPPFRLHSLPGQVGFCSCACVVRTFDGRYSIVAPVVSGRRSTVRAFGPRKRDLEIVVPGGKISDASAVQGTCPSSRQCNWHVGRGRKTCKTRKVQRTCREGAEGIFFTTGSYGSGLPRGGGAGRDMIFLLPIGPGEKGKRPP